MNSVASEILNKRSYNYTVGLFEISRSADKNSDVKTCNRAARQKPILTFTIDQNPSSSTDHGSEIMKIKKVAGLPRAQMSSVPPEIKNRPSYDCNLGLFEIWGSAHKNSDVETCNRAAR